MQAAPSTFFTMQVRFWGVRGSIPTPLANDALADRLVEALLHLGRDGGHVNLHDRKAVSAWVNALPPSVKGHVGGNTPCVEMRTAAGDIFIIDFGTGARDLGRELMKSEFGVGQGHANLFLSHYHWDHIQGWPFFRPAYVEGNQFDLYARHREPQAYLRQQQTAPFFPPASWDDMRSEVRYHEMDEGPLELCGGRVVVRSLELNHPSRSFAYRFEAEGKVFIYASDGAFLDLDQESLRPYVEFFRGADLVIFDAQFTLTESFEKRTWGHSSAVVGVELATQAGVRQLVLFHHDPGADDMQLEHMYNVGVEYALRRATDRAPVELILAREGLEITL